MLSYFIKHIITTIMTAIDILDLNFTISKRVTINLKRYLDDDKNVPLDNYLDGLVSDLEYEYNKQLEDITKEEVYLYIKNNIFNEDNMEEILSEYYPEIDVE